MPNLLPNSLLIVAAAAVPGDDGWLSARERELLSGFRLAKRRSDWRMGRWAAKRVTQRLLPGEPALGRIEIRAAVDGAPEAWLDEEPVEITLSISHSGGVAASAATVGRVRLGCDVENVEPRSDSFVHDYFTPAEEARVHTAPDADRAGVANLIWSAKESTLKALREGLRIDTRAVEVDLPVAAPGAGWSPLTARWRDTRFDGWWRPIGAQVLTLVADPPPARPRILR
jgi:4'-phosphopantetheinyl transferase